MSSKKQTPRSRSGRGLARLPLRPLLEDLEVRLVLSQTPLVMTPTYQYKMVPGPDGKMVPFVSTSPTGYSPQQMQSAYGVNLVTFGAVQGNGAGQTIAVIDAGDNPGFAPTGPNYTGSALQVFDQTFGIADPPSFQKFNQTGGTSLPQPISGWGGEIALDIEWAHAMAPMAKIDLVEANTANSSDLFTAARTAATTLGASVVSMSFGSPLEYAGQGSLEPQFDSQYFAAALATNPYVTFLASTGDHGANPGQAPNYPSLSPLVVAVGGTRLNLTASNQWASETGWSYNTDSFCPTCASGGGISNIYSEPSWQLPYQSTRFRTVPDVSSNADPATGVSVYDPYDNGASTPWSVIGGTSLSSPTWAGLIAIIDQGRALLGENPLNGPTQTLPELYALPATDFHDITQGFNYYNAGPGYDLVTGRGSPIANLLIPDMVNFAPATGGTVAIQPPSSVVQGGFFGTEVEATTSSGTVAVGYSGTATLSLVSGPAGATFTPVTVPVSSGIGIFDGISLPTLSNGTPYQFQVVISSGGTTLATLQPTPVDVASPAVNGTAVYYPLPLDQSLRNDFALAGSNSDPSSVINLVYATPYTESAGQILVSNSSGLSTKSIQVIGQGSAASVINTTGPNRLFVVQGTVGPSPNLHLLFQKLALEGGYAIDSGGLVLPGNPAVGGGVLVEGGQVAFSSALLKSDRAVGQKGQTGSGASFYGGTGGNGGNGGNAQGGGVFVAAGSLSLSNTQLVNDQAVGGAGGVGGSGGPAVRRTSRGGTSPFSFSGGPGGRGGVGGSAAGGAIYVAGGALTIQNSIAQGDQAIGGAGGAGGAGGKGGSPAKAGGAGGPGGIGGQAYGGAFYMAKGAAAFTSDTVSGNAASGGNGGIGGKGAPGGVGGSAGQNGQGGAGAIANGGGFYYSAGSLTFQGSKLDTNKASGGHQGAVPAVLTAAHSPGYTHNHSNASRSSALSAAMKPAIRPDLVGSGTQASGAGGGIYVAGSLTLAGLLIEGNSATSGGGVYGKGSLVVQGMSLSTNQATNGGAIDAVGSLSLLTDNFTGNTATADGGAVSAANALTVTNSTFTTNSGGANGGAIESTGPSTFTGSSFTSNSANNGAALEIGGASTITNDTFTQNIASARGGAIRDTATSLIISASNFMMNSAASGGALDNLGTLSISLTTFSQNSADSLGGAIDQQTGTLTLNKVDFLSNNATNGGAVGVLTPATLTGSYLSFSTDSGISGGAIDNLGTLNLSYVSISQEHATSGGGLYNSGTATLSDVTIQQSTGTATGGALDNLGTLTATNLTLASNIGGTGAGVSSLGTTTLINVTIAENTGTTGAGLEITGGTTTLINTIVAQNTGTSGPSDILLTAGAFSADSQHNLIGTGGSGGLVNGQNGNLVGIASPGLGALGFSGGPEQTIPLLAGSPAIDAGVAQVVNHTIPTLDERGAIRGPAGLNAGSTVDIGAYEASSSFLVTSTADTTDAGTLRTAVTWANQSSNANPANLANPAPNTITFDTTGAFVSPQTITLAGGVLTFTNATTPVAIAGPGADQVFISGGNAQPVLLVETGVTATFSGITIENGQGLDGGGILNDGNLSLSNMTLAHNSATEGGGVFSQGTLLKLDNVTVTQNGASKGAGVFANRFLSVKGGSFAANTASSSGGAAFETGGAGSITGTFSGVNFTSNKAGSGGAILALGALTLTNDTFTSNSATGAGGAVNAQASFNVTQSTFSLNSAATGGALQISGATLVSAVLLNGNFATSGGGGAIDASGALTLSQSTVEASSAPIAGGIYSSSTLVIEDSLFQRNTATSGPGGGLFGAGTTTIDRTTFSNNSASYGGAIASPPASSLEISNVTIADNTAQTNGGGVAASSGFTAINSTFAYNQVGTGGDGGGISVGGGMTTLYNSIVAENTVGAGQLTSASDIGVSGGSVSSLSQNNLIGTGGSGGLTNGVNHNLVGVATPGLGQLAYNGGPTPTIALNAGSPAIDAGALTITGVTIPSIDERGALRGPAGLNAGSTVDIGAYEASSSYQVITAIDSTAIGTLRTAILWADSSLNNNPANIANPAPNTIVFDPAVFSSPVTISLSLGALAFEGTVKNETIQGPGAGLLTISGSNASSVFTVASGTSVTIAGVTIANGSTQGNGGGIDNFGVLTLQNDTISNNTAALGGGVANESGGSLAIQNTQITNDQAQSGGGVMNDGSLVITDSTLSNSTASTGGGLENAGTATLSNAILQGNTATTGGGFANLGTLSVTAGTITLNTTTGLTGQGAGGDNSGVLTMDSTTVSANTSSGLGGGIANESNGTATLTNVTVALNTATSGGGLLNSGLENVVSGTIADNTETSGSGGGINVVAGARTYLYNTIVAQNVGTQGIRPSPNDIAGAIAFGSAYNLIGTGGAGGLLQGLDHNLVGVASPGLAPLAFNGGTGKTIALLAGSPALDTGSAFIPNVAVPTVDARGALRGTLGLNAGANPDIGAYEASSSFQVNTTADSLDAGTLLTGLYWTQINVNVNPAQTQSPAPNTITFDTLGLFASPQTINLPGGFAVTNTTLPVAIRGDGASQLTLNGAGAAGLFTVAAGASLTLEGVSLTGSSGQSAIVNSGTVSLINLSVSGNSAALGGAVLNMPNASLTVYGTTFFGNIATVAGGAIDNQGALQATNSTFARNIADGGGAIYAAGPTTLVNVTVAQNWVLAPGEGGGIYVVPADSLVLLANTIVASNTSGPVQPAAPSDLSGTVEASSSYNLIGTGGSGGLVQGSNGNLVGVANPGLADGLANNGGPTQTIALVAGSPAIQAGYALISGVVVPTTDQRGAIRAFALKPGTETLDIGAYEATSTYLVTSTADTNSAGTLRSAIAWADANPPSQLTPGPNTIIFDVTGTFSTPQTITLNPSLGGFNLENPLVPIVISGPGAGVVNISGGGLLQVFNVAAGSAVTISGLTISGGNSLKGAAVLNSGSLTLSDDTLSGNKAGSVLPLYGGAVYNAGTLNIVGSTFTNNQAPYGLGGALENAGTATIDNSFFGTGLAFQGGAIYNQAGSLSVLNSTFSGNAATEGGSIYNNATATITGSTVSTSTSFNSGAIANDLAGVMAITNSTIADNFADQTGGGINNAGQLAITSSTLAYNSVGPGGSGGGITISHGSVVLNDTILVLNTAGSSSGSVASDITGTVDSTSAYNLIGSGGGLTNGVDGNQVGVLVPLLGALASNGGPTQTIALLAGSPAIDAGSSTISGVTVPTTDQRGALRGPDGFNAGTTVDIGAFEASSSYLVTSTADTTDVGTLRAAVGWANNSVNNNPANLTTPSANIILFDTAGVFSTPQTITLTSGPLVFANSTTPVGIEGSTNGVTISGGGQSTVIRVASGTTATIASVTITGGSALGAGGTSGLGGGIDNQGTLTLSTSTVAASSAIDGGGIANETGATLTLEESTLSGNSGTSGGGLYNAGAANLVNDTIAQNSGLDGGGVFNTGTFQSVNVTIADNTAQTGGLGGGIDAAGGATTLYNTLVAANTLAGSTASDIAGTAAAASANNLIGTGGSGGLTSGVNGNLVGVADPGILPLGNNGGPTQTIALTPTSPAIGAGATSITGVTVPTLDQRGEPRSGVNDIGAYQLQATTSPTVVIGPRQIAAVVGPVTPPSAALTPPPAATLSAVLATTPTSVSPVLTSTTVIHSKKHHPRGSSAARFHARPHHPMFHSRAHAVIHHVVAAKRARKR